MLPTVLRCMPGSYLFLVNWHDPLRIGTPSLFFHFQESLDGQQTVRRQSALFLP